MSLASVSEREFETRRAIGVAHVARRAKPPSLAAERKEAVAKSKRSTKALQEEIDRRLRDHYERLLLEAVPERLIEALVALAGAEATPDMASAPAAGVESGAGAAEK
jgi:hypothetical protein